MKGGGSAFFWRKGRGYPFFQPGDRKYVHFRLIWALSGTESDFVHFLPIWIDFLLSKIIFESVGGYSFFLMKAWGPPLILTLDPL
jgi:hypothetical protein